MPEALPLTEDQKKALAEKLKNMSPEELLAFQKQQCIFCQIIADKIPSKKIYEDEKCLVILDINPATKGHLLLLPKEHYAIMPQLPAEELEHLATIAKKLSQLFLKALKVGGTSIFIANGLAAGQRAQHFMIHLLPRRDGDHLLPGEEKLIDKAWQQKVALALEKRLNEVLAVNKEIIHGEKEGGLPLSPPLITPVAEAPSPEQKKKRPRTSRKKKTETEESILPSPVQSAAYINVEDIADLFK